MDSSQITIYGESDEESEEDKSEPIDDEPEEEETLVNGKTLGDDTVVAVDDFANIDVTPVPIPPPSPDYSSNRTNSNSFENDSLDQVDETEYFSMDSKAGYGDDIFPHITVDSGRESLSTAAISIKRLSGESLRTISPITPTLEAQSSTIIEEDESVTTIDKEQIMKNVRMAHDAILANLDFIIEDERMVMELMAMSTQLASRLAISRVDTLTKINTIGDTNN